MTRILLDETATSLAEATPAAGGGIVQHARIIAPGWGASGYYPAEVLERDGPAAWPVGTHSYLDHPGASEDRDRPERTVRDLVGRVTSTPVYEESGPVGPGLYADLSFVSWAVPVVTELRDDIGLSIRGYADIEVGEREGRTGNVVTRLYEGISVDLVTHAGAGGRFVALMESARSRFAETSPTPPVPQPAPDPGQPAPEPLPSRLREASVDAVRTALDAVLRELIAGDKVWVWVADFDPEAGIVRYSVETPDAMAYFQDGYTYDDSTGAATLAGEPVEVRREVTYVPVNPAGPDSTEESTMPPDEQAQAALTEAAGRAQAAEAERDALRRQLAERDARDTARPIVAAIVAESVTLAPSTVSRVTEAVLAAVPVNDAGALDEPAVRTAATEARTVAEREAAEYMAASGAGTVRTFGGKIAEGQTVTAEDIDRQLVEAGFGPVPTTKGA